MYVEVNAEYVVQKDWLPQEIVYSNFAKMNSEKHSKKKSKTGWTLARVSRITPKIILFHSQHFDADRLAALQKKKIQNGKTKPTELPDSHVEDML